MPKARKRGEEDGSKRTSSLKVKGRNRICKQCRFTCTDLKEFLHHQKYAHSQEKDPEILESISKRRKSSNSNTPNNISKRATRNKSTSNNLIGSEQKNKRESVEQKKCVESEKSDTITINSSVKSSEKSDSEIIAAEKANGDDSVVDSMELDRSPENDTVDSENGIPLVNEHDDEDDRLVIAEEDQGSGLKQPTRSGNIQNRTYVCNQCEFSSTSAKIFLHHQKDEHNSDIIIYECDICEYATKYKQKLPRHRKLHFTGKDSMLSGSDLDSSYGDRERGSSFSEMIRAGEVMENIEQDQTIDDEDDEMEDEEEEEDVPPLTDTPEPQLGGVGTPTLEKKKRKTRQEVDPGKYFEVLDETGVKYACSRCGNVYKWRKSLNKHWKEKHHDDEMPDTSQPPPGLAKLSQLTHVKYRFPAVEGKRSPSTAKTVNRPEASTPVSMVNYMAHHDHNPHSSVEEANLMSSVVMPRFIGPFITDTVPVFPSATSTPNGPMAAHRESAMQMTAKIEELCRKSAHGRNSPSGGEQPIDFSVKKEPDERTVSPNRSGMQIPVSVKSDGVVVQDLLGGTKKEDSSPVLQCNRCGFIAKTLVDYSSHMTLHLNKRAFKCAECQEHFNGVDELNKHFGENHSEKIHEHKEAIQKIPHGLQQTYHLLKMPLSAIGNISSQDVPGRGESSDSKYLKCSMCNFVAKWPAELQKHAVSHSEERPFVCMVCGSTYKWKWDLVKHFEKSHNSLPNPYKRREPGSSPAPPSLKQSDASASLLKSSSSGGLYGSQPSLYPMTSTAAALLDTDSFRVRAMEGFPDEEPLRKKRRLSDTDMPNLEEEGSNDSYTKQRDMYIMAGTLDGNGGHRVLDNNGDDVDGLSGNTGSKISSLSTLREMENLIPSDDSQSRTSEQDLFNSVYLKRSVDSNTQVAISNKMKKRIEMGKTENCRSRTDKDKNSEVLLPYKCQLCEYRARWPSEITQHMKNHSDEKPYHCPRCSYKSKWKWDVVKHLKRCGGGTIKDVIDTSKLKKLAPPNVTVMPQGAFQHPPPTSTAYSSFTKNIPEKYAMSSVAEALTSTRSMLSMSDMHKAGYEAGKEFEREYIEKLRLGNGFDTNDSTQPVFRSLVNQGLYHCLECPFVANSPAELRRHGVLHSENKPFSCRVCGYSSRWKCDLKKHMKTYNHYDSMDQMSRDQSHDSLGDNSFQEESDSKYVDDFEKEDRTLFKCNKCPYVTYKKFSFEIHVKSHGDIKRDEGGLSKFKCKQCDHQANDLPSFLQHKRTHVNGHTSSLSQAEEQSTANENQQNDQMSNRTLQKHRRKPIQQFRCSKCPYTCFKRSDLEMHENMHEQRGSESYKCFYCNYNAYSKGSLLQHMKLHPEFDFGHFQEMGMTDDLSEYDDEYDMDDKNDEYESMVIDDDAKSLEERGETEGAALDLSGPSHSQDFEMKNVTRPSYALSKEPQSFNRAMKFPCEWCGERFPNVVTLYQHAAASHPLELRAQEVGETPTVTLPTRQNDPYLERQKRLQQKQEMQHKQQLALQQQHQQQQQQAKQRQMILEQQQQQQQQQMQSSFIKNALSQQPRYRPIEPKPAHSALETAIQKPSFSVSHSMNSMQKSPHDPNNNKNSSPHTSQASAMAAQSLLAKAKKSTSPNKRGRSFQCTKCSFTAPNAVTYLRHIERHGSNCRHTCRFCDYSIDRLNLLYQHMKGTHGDMWRGTPEEKISLTSGGKQLGDDMRSRTPSSLDNSDSLNNSFNGSYSDMVAEFADAENSNDSLSSSMNEWRMIAAKGPKPILIVKEETIWRGTRIQICTINGKKNYKCPNCMFVSSNSSNMAYHVKQHGANKRYQCEKCDFSADISKIVYHHMESIHPKDPIFVEKIPTKVPFVSEGSVSPEENNNRRWEDQSRASMQILPTCTKCPYKCRTVGQLQRHIDMHGMEKEHKCEMCDFSVDTQEQLLQHLVVHRQPYEPDLTQDEGDEGNSEVDQSQHQFLSKIELMPNNNRDNSNLNTKKLTSQSLSSVVSTALRTSGRLRYRCAGCPYFSYCKNNLIKHRKQHLIKSRFGCQLCDYSATRAFLLAQHMKFHENAMDTSKKLEGKQINFHDIFLDPLDEDGIMVLKNTDIPDNRSSTSSVEDDKDFSDEYNEEFEEGGEFDEESNMGEFDEEEMAALERAEFEGFTQDGGNKKEEKNIPMDGHESDDSLSEMDPMALQQQISMNLSGNIMGEEEKIRYSCSMCPYRCNALRSFKCHIHMHGLNKKYICDHCNWSADRLNLLYQHRKVHAKVPGYDPTPEDIVFLNRNYALENESKMQHIDEVLYNNFNRFKTSDHKEEKATPMKMETAVDGKKLYVCKLCPFTCSNKNNFTYHKSLHKINARYTCTECSYSVDRWNLLSKHMQLHHNMDSMKGRLHNGYSSDELHLGNMKNYEEGSPDVEPQLYFNSGESPPETDSEKEDDKAQDLKCSRCPFSTPSKDQLKTHEHHHGMTNKQMCPYCDFSARTETILLEHVQLHFPSSKLDKETLRGMLAKRGEKLQIPEVTVVKTSSRSDGYQNGEPDSTTEQHVEKESGEESESVKEKPESERTKTKVYVCQYCEREFEGKSLMLQHEKQHLIGSKF